MKANREGRRPAGRMTTTIGRKMHPRAVARGCRRIGPKEADAALWGGAIFDYGGGSLAQVQRLIPANRDLFSEIIRPDPYAAYGSASRCFRNPARRRAASGPIRAEL